MQVKLDILTVLYLLSLGNGILLLLYFSYFRQSTSAYADKFWLSAKACQAVAWALLALRGIAADGMTILLGNSLLFMGFSSECLAILIAARAINDRDKTFYAIVTTVAVLGIYLRYASPGIFSVSGVSFATFVLFMYLGGKLLLVEKGGSYLPRIFGIFVVLTSLVILVRGETFFFAQSGENLFSPLPVQILALVSMYLLMLIGGIGYLLILREKLDKELLRESRTDYLTELPNRRDFFERANQFIAYCLRKQLTVSIMLIDVDHFKTINDDHGHGVGDEVLKYLGCFLKNRIRQSDLTGRIGGEEFAVFLPDTSEADALKVAERIKQEHHFLRLGEHGITFTISIGVSTAKLEGQTGMTLEELLKSADRCLYRAKGLGRNHIVAETLKPGEKSIAN